MKLNLDLTSVKKRVSYGSRPRPLRDWLALLVIFLVLLCASLGWNLWLFSRVTNGEAIGQEQIVETDDLDLEGVQRLFDERASERERYQNEYRFVDPSL